MAEEEKNKFLRISSQALLLMNIQDILGTEPVDFPIKRKEFGYSNFCVFRSDKDDINQLDLTKYSKSSQVQNLLSNIPSSIISGLLPNVKLYKVFFDGSTNSNRNKNYIWRIPFDDIAVDLKGKTSEFQSKSIDQLLSGDGRLHGIGIKSFKYKYTGTDPISTNTNLEGEFEIYFQDIRDLARKIIIEKDDGNYVNERPQSKKEFSYSDLLITNEPVQNSYYLGTSNYSEIRALIGYSDISLQDIKNLLNPNTKNIDNVARDIKNALLSSKLILTIDPLRHDLRFEEQGNAVLKIEFIGRLQSLINKEDSNILKASKYYQTYLNAKQQFEDNLKEQKDAEINKNPQNNDKNQPTNEKKEQTDPKKNYTLALELTNRTIELNLNKVYSDIFNQLLFPESKEGGGIFSIKVDPAAFNAKLEKSILGSDKFTDNAEKIRNLTNANLIQGSYRYISKPEDLAEFSNLYNYANNLNEKSGLVLTKEQTLLKEKSTEVAADLQNKTKEQIESNEIKQEIKFIFLGDLLNIFCEILYGNKYHYSSIPRIILSNFNINIPNFDGGINTHVANIADLPISLDYLQFFFLKYLVEPRTHIMTLWDFLIKLTTELLSSATNASVFASDLQINNSVKISNTVFNMPFLNDVDLFTWLHKEVKFGSNKQNAFQKMPETTTPYLSFNGIITDTSLVNRALSYIANSVDPDYQQDIGSYMLFYCSSQVSNIPLKNNGDIIKDEKDGINHFFVGKDKGFIKKINFSRVDSPYAKESVAARTSGGLVSGISRLNEVYDCSITMFANNAFRNGDLIYIEPIVYSGRSGVDLQTVFGIGGYYQVITAETTINENIFETILKCTKTTGNISNGNKQDIAVPAANL